MVNPDIQARKQARKEADERRRKTRRENAKRRRAMRICTWELKIVSGKLSREDKAKLARLFLEGKWLRNSELARLQETGDLATLDRKAKTANVKLPDGSIESRPIIQLSSQMKRGIVDQIKQDIFNLSKSKKKGNKVGALRFKSVCNSIPLEQFNNTYYIDFVSSKVRLQGFKKWFKVRGLKQIPEGAEFANAKLVRKASGYYIHVTAYVEPEATTSNQTSANVGIDFGIANNLTLSDGTTYNVCLPEDKRVKRASRKMNRSLVKEKRLGIKSPKRTSNHLKRSHKVALAHERLANKKRDAANKIVSEILSSHDFIAVQDEMISNWQKGLFGAQVQHSCMGKIIAKLKMSPKVHVVPTSFASTQICPVCGEKTKHPLSERSYKCSHCGYEHPDRDVKAAQSILDEAIRLADVSPERRTKSPVEAVSSGQEGMSSVPDCVKAPPMKQEAQVL